MGETLSLKDIKVHPTVLPNGETGWITLEPIIFKDQIIPPGFFFNGGNVPRPFWVLISPNDPMLMACFAVHDFLCDKKQYIKADNYYEEIAIQTKVVKWKRVSTVGSIRFYTRWIR